MKGIPNTPKIEMTIFTHGYGIVNFATIQNGTFGRSSSGWVK